MQNISAPWLHPVLADAAALRKERWFDALVGAARRLDGTLMSADIILIAAF